MCFKVKAIFHIKNTVIRDKTVPYSQIVKILGNGSSVPFKRYNKAAIFSGAD